MLSRILVPLDGSTLAERALPVAARLARTSGCPVLLLRVYQAIPSEFTPALVVGSETADEREADAYLAHAGECASLAGVAVERVALGGAVAQAILDAVAAYQVDTIVMTSHGRSGITRRALGSAAEHIVRHATVPTLILRGEEIAPLAETRSVGVIWRGYIGLDGSERAAGALEPAAHLLRTLAGADPAEARLLTIVQPLPVDTATPSGTREYERHFEQASEALRAAAARLETGNLARYGVRAGWAVVEATDAADALATAAEHPERVRWKTSMDEAREEEDVAPSTSEGARFIAVATRGGAGLRRWALGCVTEHVLEGSRLPLLIVPVVPA